VAALREAYEQAWRERAGRPGAPPKLVTPRLLLIHSLPHAVIRQLSPHAATAAPPSVSVDVGSTWKMAGLLVFTSSPAWYSSDHLCIEGAHARSEPANGAACHACLLAAETSCEEFNTFLDRALLVGTPAQPELGFFEDYLCELRS
jgi:hypothetical protein